MKRSDAEEAAALIATAIVAFEERGNEEGANGVRLSAMALANVVCRGGAVEPTVWLSWCGIYPKGREKKFRGERKAAPLERVLEAVDQGAFKVRD